MLTPGAQRSNRAISYCQSLIRATPGQTLDRAFTHGTRYRFDNRIVLYKNEQDVSLFVVGSMEDNEILLYNVILALRDSLHLLFK